MVAEGQGAWLGGPLSDWSREGPTGGTDPYRSDRLLIGCQPFGPTPFQGDPCEAVVHDHQETPSSSPPKALRAAGSVGGQIQRHGRDQVAAASRERIRYELVLCSKPLRHLFQRFLVRQGGAASLRGRGCTGAQGTSGSLQRVESLFMTHRQLAHAGSLALRGRRGEPAKAKRPLFVRRGQRGALLNNVMSHISGLGLQSERRSLLKPLPCGRQLAVDCGDLRQTHRDQTLTGRKLKLLAQGHRLFVQTARAVDLARLETGHTDARRRANFEGFG